MDGLDREDEVVRDEDLEEKDLHIAGGKVLQPMDGHARLGSRAWGRLGSTIIRDIIGPAPVLRAGKMGSRPIDIH